MAAIAGSLVTSAIKFVCFIAIAYGGIVCGKKYKDKKSAAESMKEQESK